MILNVNDQNTSMVLGERNITLYGKGYIVDTLCGHTFAISPSAFYQVNPVQTEILYQTAMDYAGLTGKETVVSFNLERSQKFADCLDNRIGFFIINQAAFHRDNFVGAFLISTGDGFAFFKCKNSMYFVAVMKRVFHTDDRKHRSELAQKHVGLSLFQR